MIKVEHANKTFSGKYGTVHALQDVSIHVEKGDIYGIIGFSGAGKSTLIRLVNGLETPDTGNVIVQGENLGNLKKTQLRKLRRSEWFFSNLIFLNQKQCITTLHCH